MKPQLPAPTARGVFVKTPFPHLLLYALERRLSGSFELYTGELTTATFTVIQGCPAKVRTHESVHYLGEVMAELGIISPQLLQASLDRLREAPRLHGQILAEMGTPPQAIDAGLRAQVERKLEHLFSLPADTAFAYYDGIDVLYDYGGPPTPIDPLPVLWRGVRESPPWEHVDATLRRLGPAGARIADKAEVERFGFGQAEWQLVELMRQRPLRILDLTTTKIVGPSLAQTLLYFLMITKQVDLVDPASITPSSAATNPASGQAFARVQLAARPASRTPMVVEEVASNGANDERASSPGAHLSAEQNALKTKILERANQITSQDYYQMLGVDRDASTETVQKAFLALAKVWHPDRLPGALGDVRDACSKVFSHLTEAHATLADPERRTEYMTLLREGGATPDDQAKIQAVLEAATDFQKAEFLMKRSAQDPQAYELVKRAMTLDPEQVDYLALFTWLEAQRPEWMSREKTLEKIAVLDTCVRRNNHSERAYFYRAMLYKRIDETSKAARDFRRAGDLNPRNLDALREVRLHAMRGGTKPPPGPSGSPGRASKPPQPETLGGLFGKLFKK